MVPLNIPELVLREIFLIRVRLPGVTAIIFAQSCNFELKFFVDNPFMKKTTLQVQEVIFNLLQDIDTIFKFWFYAFLNIFWVKNGFSNL